ncbi:hypothetical protein JKP88DRAFT_325855 [Tribonema minus]|uniref:Transmembrane protein n=1 Tax=Tribonema minus TaxID=303371 RepID=A0A835YSE6_9STRA|nr:hypothetical protein JKP88DRAFT_325855 [Tribonema minus]
MCPTDDLERLNQRLKAKGSLAKTAFGIEALSQFEAPMIMFRASFVLALLVVLAPASRERGGKPARAAHDDEQPFVEIVDDPNEDPKGDNEEWDEGALVEKEGGIAPRDRGILESSAEYLGLRGGNPKSSARIWGLRGGKPKCDILESSAEYLGLRGGNPKALLVQLGRAAIVASAAYIIGEKAFKFVRARKSAAAEAESSEAVVRHAVKDAAKGADKPAGVAHIGATASGDEQQHVEPPAEEPSPTIPLEDGYHERVLATHLLTMVTMLTMAVVAMVWVSLVGIVSMLVDDFEEEQRLEQELAAEHEQQLDQAVLDEIESYEEAETMFYGQDTRVEPPLPPPPAAATSSHNVDEEAAKPSP